MYWIRATLWAIATSFICATSASLAAPQTKLETDTILYSYHICLSGQFTEMSKIDFSTSEPYPLMKIEDADVIHQLESRCDATRTKLLAAAVDPVQAEKALAEFKIQEQKVFLDRLRKLRPVMAETIKTIRTPGPRAAIVLSQRGASGDDYPPSAIRNEESGQSNATFTIGVDGLVSECSAIGATESLNEATCRVIQRHWKYAPAIDAQNRPVPEVRSASMNWVIQ